MKRLAHNLVFMLTGVFVLLGSASPGMAADAETELDPAMLIDKLAEEGMSELLLHLAQTQPPDDPVLARQIEIAGLRIEYQRLLGSAMGGADPAEAEQRRRDVLDAYRAWAEAMRSLIKDFYDHDQRPIWQTDLAQSLILDDLYGLHQDAPLFLDFGVTSPEQDQALGQIAPEALALLVDADLRLFNLRNEVGRDEARSQQLQASGLFFRLFDEYDQKRTPYMLALAAYLVAQLPDDTPYYADPDSSVASSIPRHEDDPQRERQRLLRLADDRLTKLMERAGGGLGIHDAASVLLGRVLLARGRFDQAIDQVGELLASRNHNTAWLTAKLVRIASLYRRGSVDQALRELSELRQDPVITSETRRSLLVTDMTHKLLLAEADLLAGDKRDAAVAASYDPYLELLAGPMTGPQAKGLRDYIYRRWEATLDSDPNQASALPPVVRLAISQVLRLQGQAVLDSLDDDSAPSQTDQRLALRAEAKEKFKHSIALAKTLTSDDIPPDIRSEAMFNLALAMHGENPNDPANRLALTRILTDLADQMPDQPVAEDAISASVALLREMHQVLPTPPGVEQAYQRAAQVLFSKFPTSEAADSERLYYGYTIYEQAGKYRDAINMFSRVPFDHDDYFRARRQSLLSLFALWRESDPTARPRLRRELDSLMRSIATEAGRNRESLVNPERAETARRAEATVRLVKAQLAMLAKDYIGVTDALNGFEAAYPKQADLIGEALQLRVIALGDAGDREQLAKTTERMVRDYPDQAAPVIDQVLTTLEDRLDQLHVKAATAGNQQREQIDKEKASLAQAAEVLSKYLLQWANTQGYDEQTLMPFQVIRAKTLRMTGDLDGAYAILAKLVHDYPNDAQVMVEYAEVLYQKGDEDSLVEAVRYYDRLITGLGAPYPPEWWTAWMRRLQINDRLGEGTDDIPLRVQQLQMTDPDLGGPVTKLELKRLEQKYRK